MVVIKILKIVVKLWNWKNIHLKQWILFQKQPFMIWLLSLGNYLGVLAKPTPTSAAMNNYILYLF